MTNDSNNPAAPAVHSSDWFAASGWRKFPVADRGRHEENWAKKFETPTECSQNTGKRMQVVAYVWPPHADGMERGVELELCAELPCGHWVNFQSYSLRESELPNDADAQCAMLLRAWEAAANARLTDEPANNTTTPKGKQ